VAREESQQTLQATAAITAGQGHDLGKESHQGSVSQAREDHAATLESELCVSCTAASAPLLHKTDPPGTASHTPAVSASNSEMECQRKP